MPRLFGASGRAASLRPARGQSWTLFGPALMVLVLVAVLYAMSRQWAARWESLVVYTAQDQVYSEPILQAFQQETGIRVRTVYDSEAVKTVGLVNRLIAEREHPQCDIFWNNEAMRMHQLEARGVLEPSTPWASLGYRSRRIVVNTNRLPVSEAPQSLTELTNAVWQGKIAVAYPLFGTTSTHFLALRQHWGDPAWRAWCRALRANEPLMVDGNSVVVKMVGRGEAWVGLTDSDDIAAGQREGWPITALPLSAESLLIPNTVAVVRGAPHPTAAPGLMDYLRRPETVLQLVDSGALEAVTSPDASVGLHPDWAELLEHLDEDTQFLREVFLR